MHIVYLSTSGYLGGAEVALRDLVASVRAARPGWTLNLISPGEGPLVDESRRLGLPTVVLPFPAGVATFGEGGSRRDGLMPSARVLLGLPRAIVGGLQYLGPLRRLLADWRPDIIHANGLKMHLAASFVAPPAAKLVWHVHDYLTGRPLASRLLRWRAARADVALANSPSVAVDLRSVFGDRLQVAMLQNAVDLARFRPEGPALDLDAQAGLPPAPPGTVRIGLVATMAWWKGHRVFLEAFRQLPAHLSARGYVVGGPVYETAASQQTVDELRHLAAEFGLADRVGFTGFVSEPEAAMRALDIVVHASTQPEPFGLVIAEAMACARPIIVSRGGGAADLIEDGVTGLLFEPGRASELADRLVRLAGDRCLCSKLGAAARAVAVDRFDARRLGEELAPIYEELSLRRAPSA